MSGSTAVPIFSVRVIVFKKIIMIYISDRENILQILSVPAPAHFPEQASSRSYHNFLCGKQVAPAKHMKLLSKYSDSSLY
jgi:hypothetical protein